MSRYDWSVLADHGGPDGASLCGLIPHPDGEASPCDETASYSLFTHEPGLWYALCVAHTALVRTDLGAAVVAGVQDVRPVGASSEVAHAALVAYAGTWLERAA